MIATRTDCVERDVHDPLSPLRAQFAMEAVDAAQEIYLDGNSLGALPRATLARIQQVARNEWGRDLIRSWNTAGWMYLSRRVGDKVAPLIGASPGEVMVGDSTSVNLYKALSVALALTKKDAPSKRVVMVERSEFPSDLYLADTVSRERGFELRFADAADLSASLDANVAVVLLTQANYRTGRLYPMAEITRAAHQAGALIIWDLSHTVGALPVNLKGVETETADFAVGCGYKFLNGGPGAPAFIWVNPALTERMDREGMRQPLSGWLGHASPFAFDPDYRPGAGMSRFICGTPAILSMAALECGVDVFHTAEVFGGLPALREKSIALTRLFIDLVDSRCAGLGLSVVTPRNDEERSSQICIARSEGAYAIVQALIARGVIGDFRAPDILRFGIAPLYTRFADIWDAVERLEEVLRTQSWRSPRFERRSSVT